MTRLFNEPAAFADEMIEGFPLPLVNQKEATV
jgi:hypothetical protein